MDEKSSWTRIFVAIMAPVMLLCVFAFITLFISFRPDLGHISGSGNLDRTRRAIAAVLGILLPGIVCAIFLARYFDTTTFVPPARPGASAGLTRPSIVALIIACVS